MKVINTILFSTILFFAGCNLVQQNNLVEQEEEREARQSTNHIARSMAIHNMVKPSTPHASTFHISSTSRTPIKTHHAIHVARSCPKATIHARAHGRAHH